MNVREILSQIVDRGHPDRELMVDDLNDGLGAGRYDEDTSRGVVLGLIELVRTEDDPAVHESILNLLSGFYRPSGSCGSEIEDLVLARMGSFAVGSMEHALAIVAESQLVRRDEILAFYAASDSEAVREVAQYYRALGATSRGE